MTTERTDGANGGECGIDCAWMHGLGHVASGHMPKGYACWRRPHGIDCACEQTPGHVASGHMPKGYASGLARDLRVCAARAMLALVTCMVGMHVGSVHMA